MLSRARAFQLLPADHSLKGQNTPAAGTTSDLPAVELPAVELPAVELPAVELAAVDLPDFPLCRTGQDLPQLQ